MNRQYQTMSNLDDFDSWRAELHDTHSIRGYVPERPNRNNSKLKKVRFAHRHYD